MTKLIAVAVLACGLGLWASSAHAGLVVDTVFPEATIPGTVIVPVGGFTGPVNLGFHFDAHDDPGIGLPAPYLVSLTLSLFEVGGSSPVLVERARFTTPVLTAGESFNKVGQFSLTASEANAIVQPGRDTLSFQVGNPVIRERPFATPEPGTAVGALIGLGMIGLVARRRRRHTDSPRSHVGYWS